MSQDRAQLQGYIAGLLIGCGVAPAAAWDEARRVVGGAVDDVEIGPAPAARTTIEIQLKDDPAAENDAPRPLAEPPIIAADGIPDGLTPLAEKVWPHLERLLPATGARKLQFEKIAHAVGCHPQSVKKVINLLVERGLVRRHGRTRATRYELVRGAQPDGAAPEKVLSGTLSSCRPRRRFETHFKADPSKVQGLPDEHPALTEGRTLFPTTVVEPMASPRLLVSGANQRKLGDRVVKGPWRGMPIFLLTLEERATCPDTCYHWSTCYGNGMPLARRHRHGADLVAGLERELTVLAGEHPRGFVVRLHTLGDFYSAEYVDHWTTWLMTIPELHVFGYSAWPAESEIAKRIVVMNEQYPSRAVIRFSAAEPKPGGATTIWRIPDAPTVPEGIVCPSQTGATACCGTCGLCWHPAAKNKTIVFIAHGQSGPQPEAKLAPNNTRAAEPWPTEAREIVTPMIDGELADHKPFKAPVERRCVCGRLFKSLSAADDACTICLADRAAAAGKLTKCPPTGKGIPLPHAESTKTWRKSKKPSVRLGARPVDLPT